MSVAILTHKTKNYIDMLTVFGLYQAAGIKTSKENNGLV